MCCRKRNRCGRANYYYERSVEVPQYHYLNSGRRQNSDHAREPLPRADADQGRRIWRPNATLSLMEILAEKVRVAHENKMMRHEAARRKREQRWRQLKQWLSGDSDAVAGTGKAVAPLSFPSRSQSPASRLYRHGKELQHKDASVSKPSSSVFLLPSASASRPTPQGMSSHEDEPPPPYDAVIAHPPRKGLDSRH